MYLDIIIQEFCEYVKNFRGYSPETIRRLRTTLQLFQKRGEITTMNEISEDKVRLFFYHGSVILHWKPNTFIGYHSGIRVFFEWCIKNKYLQTNFAHAIEVPKPPKQLPRKLPKHQAMKILEVVANCPFDTPFARVRNYAMFSTYLFAGLRKSELLRLTLIDVDLQNHVILVRQGKGNKDRNIPMSTTLVHTLKRYLEYRNKHQKSCPEFFTSQKRNGGVCGEALGLVVAKVRKACGFYFTLHQLRHTFATLMLEGGCDIYSLSKMMGHADIKTTTVYLSASVEHLRAQITKHPLNNSNL
ncbi:MAG: hypothetical protein JWN78_833 [Bacteroidota bacterium]|nr:hypothetical protein [Bacteroidota bacterium]